MGLVLGAFEQITDIARLAEGTTPDGSELTFSFPAVLDAINLASANQIAVLGMEVFQRRPDGFYAAGCSSYQFAMNDWPTLVEHNKVAALKFVQKCSALGSPVFVITSASLTEFQDLKSSRGQ